MSAVAERFWSKVDRRGSGECWPWTASRNQCGYGNVKFGGKLSKAHRIALTLHTGKPVGKGLCVLHSCDNPACCNPAHLSVGTHAENMRDRATKGRAPSGYRFTRKYYPRVLNEEIARRVKAFVRAGFYHREIAELFGISRSSVQRAIYGKEWSHV